MGLVTAVTGVASVLSGPVAGVVADRVNRRLLIAVCDGARCVLYALIPIAWLFGTPVWLIYVVVPVAGVFATLFQVTYVTMVPALVGPGQITKANGYLYGTYAVVSVAGPALAGIVAAAFGPATAIGIDAVTFAVAAVGILFVRVRATQRSVERTAAGSRWRSAGEEFLAGARFLLAHPVLRPLTILLSMLTFLTFGLTDVVIYRLKHDLAQPDSTVGLVLTAGTVGTFVASLLVSSIRKRLGFGISWVGAYSLAGVVVAGLGLAARAPVIGVSFAVLLFGTGLAGICSMSLRQEVTPSHLLGRVTSAFWTIHSALGPLGAAAVTAAVSGFGVRTVCLTIGVAMLLIALAGSRTGVWQARPERLATATG
jgi:MFS family permease